MKKQIKILLLLVIFLSNIFTYSITANNISETVNLNSIIEEPKTYVSNKDDVFIGYTNCMVNVRKEPERVSKFITQLEYNTPVIYSIVDDNWVMIKCGQEVGYIYKTQISNDECDYIEYSVPNNDGFKSYMGYKTITSKTSKQYDIQQNYAYTGFYGIRQVNGRYCIALGSYCNASLGQYVDLILANGEIIPCIMAEAKSDAHTDNNNLFTISNNCCSEFIVDTSSLHEDAKQKGNISYCCEEWNSPVTIIKVYDENIYK